MMKKSIFYSITIFLLLITFVIGIGEENNADYQIIQTSSIINESIPITQFEGNTGTIDYKTELNVEEFKTPQGYKGWKTIIPGGRPLATPCIGNGKIYIGGGFGSYEFYCFDGKTGELDWLFHCGDDGPTAAVYLNNRVAFNTESCILYVLDAKTGETIWEEWLGDPLMAQPAISEDRIYITYPSSGNHILTCRDLETGNKYWDFELPGEVITAPIIDGYNCYVSCLDGTVFTLGKYDGELLWKEQKFATSAPWIYKDNVFLSLREESEEEDEHGQLQYEGLGRLHKNSGDVNQDTLWNKKKADYLRYEIYSSSELALLQESHDASVGFAGSGPSSAKLEQAETNLGISNVSGVWAYQGSRPVIIDNRSYFTQGNYLVCINAENGDEIWEMEYRPDESEGRVLTPPSIAGEYIYVGSIDGNLICYNIDDGKQIWSYNVGEPIIFQPSIWNGKVYAGTNNGTLICIDTGEKDADGWYMWGGNSEHNGWVE
jgi:outer membrane protein assembly factor BamB